MSSITKLSSGSQTFIAKLAAEGSKSVTASIAIARVIAYSLPMPTSKVEDINSYFNVTSKMAVNDFIYKLNEIVIIDAPMVLHYVQKFYAFRYDIVYPNGVVIALKANTGIVDFFGISKYFDNITLETIATCSAKITEYSTKINIIKDELSK